MQRRSPCQKLLCSLHRHSQCAFQKQIHGGTLSVSLTDKQRTSRGAFAKRKRYRVTTLDRARHHCMCIRYLLPTSRVKNCICRHGRHPIESIVHTIAHALFFLVLPSTISVCMHEKTLVTLSVNITRIRLTSLLSDVPRRRTKTLHANTTQL